MNTLHPMMAAALRPFVKPRRTDGPWEYDAEAHEVIAPHCGYHDEPIATVGDADSEGNGYLLAAAPDLLAALKDCREALRRAGADGELAVVDAAIAKAGCWAHRKSEL